MARRDLRLLMLAPLSLAAAGCMTTSEATPARLEITTPSCLSAPNLAAAAPMTKATLSDEFSATVRFADTTACLADAGGVKSVYAVLVLPEGQDGGVLTVTSRAVAQTIFSPRLQLLHAQGTVTRQV